MESFQKSIRANSSDLIRLNKMEKPHSPAYYATTEEHFDSYDTSYGYSEDEQERTAEERALVRKLDLYIMPIVCILDFIQVTKKEEKNNHMQRDNDLPIENIPGPCYNYFVSESVL